MSKPHNGNDCVIPGACPSGFRASGRLSGKQRMRHFKRLVESGYEAIYQELEIPMTRTGPKLSHGDKLQLVALKRIAEKLYHDAFAANGIIDSRAQATNEELARREAKTVKLTGAVSVGQKF